MAKSWSASITVDLGTITLEEIQKDPEFWKEYCKDLNNPTEAEIRRYFTVRQMNMAESNDGSEMIANEHIDIEVD